MIKRFERKIKYFLLALSASFAIALLRGFSLMSVIDGISVVAIVLLVATLCKIVGNIGFFDSFIFGAKLIGELLRNKRDLLASGSEGYYEYKRNKRKNADIGDLGFTAAIFLAISVFSAFAVSI